MTSQQDLDTAVITREIESVLVSSAGLAPATFDAGAEVSLEELGLDSLAVMELRSVVWDRYGVPIPDESLELSVSQIATQIGSHLNGRS